MSQVKVILSAALMLQAANLCALAADVVDATEVAAALKRGAIVWDVRGSDDYASGHIPGAVNIGALNSKIKSLESQIQNLTAEVKALKGAKR